MYSGLKQTWTKLCQMPGSGHLRHHASVVLRKHLYVLGGFGRFRVISNKTYMFSIETGCWEDLPQLAVPVFGALACAHSGVHGDRVFVMKGSVEYWAEGDQCWTLLNVKDMPWSSGILGCCCLGTEIYVATTRELIAFDPNNSQCRILSVPSALNWSDSSAIFLQQIDEFILLLISSWEMSLSNEIPVIQLVRYHPATDTFTTEHTIRNYSVKHFLVYCAGFFNNCIRVDSYILNKILDYN